jgi:hypothetical protein
VTCSDPVAASQICGAMHRGNFVSVTCNGHNWSVGSCGGTELSVDTTFCSCSFIGHTVRPCLSDVWGGVNTETCDGPSQNMQVICE